MVAGLFGDRHLLQIMERVQRSAICAVVEMDVVAILLIVTLLNADVIRV